MLTIGSFGQRPGLSTYTLLTFGFPLSDSSASEVISTLEKAANEIVEAYPFVAGQIILEGKTATNSGTFKIVEYEPHAGNGKFLHVKDCKELCPSFEELVKSHAPASMLDGSVISPAYGFVNFYPAGK